jgi:hypothetical protein
LAGFSKTLYHVTNSFYPEDEGSKFLRNFGKVLHHFNLKMVPVFPSKILVNSYRIASLHILKKNIARSTGNERGLLIRSTYIYIRRAQAVVQFLEALRNKPKGHGFDSRLLRWNFSLT